MKHLLVLVLLFFTQMQIWGQKFIDGPANIRDKANGVAFISLNDNVFVDVGATTNDWIQISFIGNIVKGSVVNGIVLKGTEIVDSHQKIIGKFLTDKSIDMGMTEQSNLQGFIKTQLYGTTYKSNLKELSFAEIFAKKNIQFSDSSSSKIVIFEDNGAQQQLRYNTDYKVVWSRLSNEITPFVVRSEKRVFESENKEKVDSKIKLTFFPRIKKTPSFSIEKNADVFELKDDILVSKTYGCCGAEDDIELSTFPDNNAFLTCNKSYYKIIIPNTNHQFYLGFNLEPKIYDETGIKLGELNYALDCTTTGKVVFSAKDKSVFDKIANFTPEITLISESPKDEVSENQDGRMLMAWSLSGVSDKSKLSGVGVKITFENASDGSTREIKLLLKNGDFEPKNIIIDF